MPPDSARVVIVGAGIAGASVAHHLAERGWDQIVVVDQGPLWETGGSTSHAPGLVFQHNASHTMTRLAQWTVELLTALDAFHPVGSIEVATTQERWAELDRRWARARAFGLEAALLDPAQVAELLWLVDREAILGGLHVADDGIAKAVRAAQALSQHDAITAFGDCEVTGLMIEGGRAAGVQTALGDIRAEHVVIAAGIWGRRVAKLAPGLNVPLVPVEHQLAYTAPLPELAGETREVVHPILRHQDHAMYFRQVRDAYAIGNYRHEPRLAEPERPAELPFTPDDFATARAEAGRLLPALRDVELTRAFNGLMSFTPDGFPLLGESAAARNLWLAQAIWVTHSAGCGRALAELMTHGDALLDLHECDPQRYDAHGTSPSYARVRGAQGYREVYDVIHPRQQSEQARGLRTTPFYERQADLGAHFFESAGWERPQWYEANRELLTGDEVLPARRVGRARLVAGRRRPSTAPAASGSGSSTSRRSPRSRSAAPARWPSCSAWRPTTSTSRSGVIVYTAMLSPRGRDHVRPDDHAPRRGPLLGRHRRRGRAPRPRVDAPPPARRRLGRPHRPHLVAVLPRRLGPAGARARGRRAREDDLSNEAQPYMRAGDAHIGHVPCRALRVSYVGELGWEIYAPAEFGRAPVGHAVGGRAVAGRGRVRRRAPTTRCAWRRATASGARTSTRSTTPTRPAWAGPCGWARTRTSSAATRRPRSRSAA